MLAPIGPQNKNDFKPLTENPAFSSYRVKTFLEDKCHIVTTSKPAGRNRAVSVKDLHSCRHTFCYFAGFYGIPLNIVQGIVGHLTPEMTKLYSDHATLEAKREKMQLLPDFLNLTDEDVPQPFGDCSRNPEVLDLLKKIPSRYTDELKMLLEFLGNANPRAIVELRRQLAG